MVGTGGVLRRNKKIYRAIKKHYHVKGGGIWGKFKKWVGKTSKTVAHHVQTATRFVNDVSKHIRPHAKQIDRLSNGQASKLYNTVKKHYHSADGSFKHWKGKAEEVNRKHGAKIGAVVDHIEKHLGGSIWGSIKRAATAGYKFVKKHATRENYEKAKKLYEQAQPYAKKAYAIGKKAIGGRITGGRITGGTLSGGGTKKKSRWNTHVAKVARANKGLSFRQIISKASASYRR